jgi:hypothetical protein
MILALKNSQDERFLYKGESDALFEENLKRMLMESRRDQARQALHWFYGKVWCKVLKDIPCETSIEAEALDMCLSVEESNSTPATLHLYIERTLVL